MQISGWTTDPCGSNIVGCFDGGGGGFYRGIGFASDGDWLVQVGDGDLDTHIQATPGTWHYVSAVYSESNIAFYCDGSSPVYYGSPGSYGPYSSTLTFGFDADGGYPQWLDGEIEETTVFDPAAWHERGSRAL